MRGTGDLEEEKMYRIMPPDNMQSQDTWIIAFCPDSNSFFVTNQRAFYWEYQKKFESEKSAIEYFESNVDYFLGVNDEIMSEIGAV